MSRVVLVTGVSRYLGGRVAKALAADPSIGRVIGVDIIPPPHDIGRAEFVRADIRNPLIGKIMLGAEVDTVVHMNVIATPTFAGGRDSQKEINVIGTMQLLAAAQKSPHVKRLLVKSSAAVYGSGPRDPAMFVEDAGARSVPRKGFGKDSIEVEGYVRGFSRRRPDVEVLMLRFANIIGPRIRTSMTDYFSLPVVPIPLGFDARMQFVHEDDAVAAMVFAVASPVTGAVNIAGDGFITARQGAALVSRPWVGIPLQASGVIGGLAKRFGLADFSPDQMSFLAYGRGLDTTRMRTVLGFEPLYTTMQTFENFAESVSPVIAGIDMSPAGVLEVVTSPFQRALPGGKV